MRVIGSLISFPAVLSLNDAKAIEATTEPIIIPSTAKLSNPQEATPISCVMHKEYKNFAGVGNTKSKDTVFGQAIMVR
ncbi:MAG: hypothetical protein GWN01_08555 [Nitrosopumilaceae archaeon]|nr:hypothetical protein [Nitrosopumilaceae archaeon]NIU00965.1 hypothetical protein [Nitrosopumilaceae archaeon]NIU87423.1 hypothetical protein [Nitrosopumilaceae archaeon]NIV65945.1 hypothetical protein [Nitrosopumilaceae archaeon]NIX61567.1 hypothetical protein [Nitrosopumilaceae archaeon]